MSRDPLAKLLQQHLLQQIPISQALGITVADASLDEIAIVAPLSPNLNHRGTAFGGSIAAVAILSGWSLVYIRLEAANEKPNIVIQHSEIRYLKPVLGPFTARARLTDAGKWSHFRETLSRHGKARITLSELYRQVYGEVVPTATVRQYVEIWLAVKEHETATATYAAYQKSTAKFLAFLGMDAERDIAEIRQAHISGFRNSLAKKVTPGTVNFDLRCIRMVFRAARRDSYILEDPAEFVGSIKRDNQNAQRRPFSVEEIQDLLSNAVSNGKA
jgi:thioesterase domain-containing protein